MDAIDGQNGYKCAYEPIHIPGKIQPHGYLIAFDKERGKIEYVSENIIEITGYPASKLLGRRFAQVFNGSLPLYVEQAIKSGKLDSYLSIEITSYDAIGGKSFFVIGHCYKNNIILEFEPKDDAFGYQDPFSWLDNIQYDLQDKKSLQEILDETLSELKQLTRFDRLMVYKFSENGSGKVIAEAREDEIEPFLGLHFPAIDIPPVARELFIRNWIRQTSSVSAGSVSVLSHTEQPLDMTYSSLRSMSPCHMEYLTNMGVEASFSISIIHEQKLWGLLACHHYLPKFVGFHRRNMCQLFGRFLSLIIPSKEKEEIRNYVSKKEGLLDRVVLNIHSAKNFYEAFKEEIPHILESVDACGLVLFLNNEITRVGQAPSHGLTKTLIKKSGWSPESLSYIQENDLHTVFEDADPADFNGCCGYLSFRIPEMGNGCLILFRPEFAQTISWAGNPQNELNYAAEGETLTPRTSFELFLEEVNGKAKAWERYEIDFIERFIAKLKDEIILFQGGELQKTTSILQAIYENSMDALFLVDFTTDKVMDCNEQAVRFFELKSKKELIGKTGWEFHRFPTPEAMQKDIKMQISNGDIHESEVEYRLADGKIRWGSLHAKVINDPEINVYLVRVIDITEKKQIEESIYLKNQELLKLNKELDRFVYSSSHDLRAPISSMKGLFELVEQIDDREEIMKLLKQGKKSLKRLDQFISDILNYSRNTRLEVKLEKINLLKLVQGIFDDYQFIHTKNPIQLKLDIAPDHYITTDAYRIKVVLNNIVSNAFKYRNPYIDNSFVQVVSEEFQEYHRLIIRDNGLGIGKEHLAKVFDMFYRADDQQAGSGLGLYIVKEMIDKLDGKISLESEVNQGSSCMIQLPKQVARN